ncbi:MAG: hypothetical protein ACRCZ9_08305 [Fusobacteriaceae bacterium]
MSIENNTKFSHLFQLYKMMSTIEFEHPSYFRDKDISSSVEAYRTAIDELSIRIGMFSGKLNTHNTVFYKGRYYYTMDINIEDVHHHIIIMPGRCETVLDIYVNVDDDTRDGVMCINFDTTSSDMTNISTELYKLLANNSSVKKIQHICNKVGNNYKMVQEKNILKYLGLEKNPHFRKFQPIIIDDDKILAVENGIFKKLDISEFVSIDIKIVLVEKDECEAFSIHALDDRDTPHYGSMYSEVKLESGESLFVSGDNHEFLYVEGMLDNVDIKAKKAGRSMSRLPTKALDKVSSFVSKFRELYRRYKQNRDDKFREQLINDEIIPFFDEVFTWLATAAVIYGSHILLALNPIMTILAGAITKIFLSRRTRKRKEIALMFLKKEIEIIDEKVNDARNANNNQAKYALMRIKGELEKKLEMIRYDNRLS